MDQTRVTDPSDLGRAIRTARGERGWDQATLAERIGVTRSTLAKVERGHAGSVVTALRALTECGYDVLVGARDGRSVDEPQDD